MKKNIFNLYILGKFRLHPQKKNSYFNLVYFITILTFLMAALDTQQTFMST